MSLTGESIKKLNLSILLKQESTFEMLNYKSLCMRGETWGDYEYSNNTSKVNYGYL